VLVIRRVIVAVFVLVLAAVAGVVGGCGGLSGDAVARIGDVEILKSTLDSQAKLFNDQSQVPLPGEDTDPKGWAEFESQVLDYLVTCEMTSQKAPELGVSVTDEEVQTQIDSIKSSFQGDEAAFTQAVTDAGYTLETLKASYKQGMLLQKVIEKVTATVTEVPQEEIAAYYEANKAAYYVEETRAGRHILIEPGQKATSSTTTTTTAAAGFSTTSSSTTTTSELTDADWATALSTAKRVRSLLAGGGDWTKLAAQYSADPGSKDSGGDLGEMKKGVYVKEFEDAAFSLAQDEISEPVKSMYGYHIIQITGITPASQKTLEEVTDTIKAQLLDGKKQEAWIKWIADTKKELGVIYREGMEPTTTTSESATTTVVGETTTTAAGQTIDTSATTATTAKP
jgi:parvulin-like peptidyl-prolyl isomerase